MDLAALRQEYMRAGLHEKDLQADPLAQFGNWFDEALQSGVVLPNAMTLATATKTGRPSARAVLLKGFDALGFVFYTHYRSRKGRELEENPQAMLLFCWTELERQVGIEGRVARVSAAESPWRAGRRSKCGWKKRPSAFATPRPARRIGAGTVSLLNDSSSGRAARIASTTACVTTGRGAPGKSNGWRPEGRPAGSWEGGGLEGAAGPGRTLDLIAQRAATSCFFWNSAAV